MSAANVPSAPIGTNVEVALDQLDPLERAVLDLIYRQGFTQTEVATRSDLSLAAVRALVSRGMSTIRDLIAPRTDAQAD